MLPLLEPIAVVGMACRFAGGVDSPEKFWTLLRSGADVIGKLPEGRWDWYAAQGRDHAVAVRSATSRGAFLDDIRGFDADFFGITPREAALMDPQQRIILELAWEALEDAGIAPERLAGTDTGVFMGVGSDDYGRRMLEDLPRIQAWTGIGGSYCGVANRVSHLLDLRGPSMAVDTACSSSLVTIHLAAQALRAGDCPVALAGGVLVIASPGLSLVLDAAGATAPDGQCKSFSADADGYGRGEGGGVIVLKRLDDARRDGDRVLAILRGSAVHQDGRTNGIMAPNGDAQAHLMRRAYASAGVDPATIGYVEAHGTGTRAGDPLEAAALGAVLGSARPAGAPLLIGSAKPNVGHLEAGAGVTGVIKAVLALRHGEIPPSLNVRTPNPAIPWDAAGLRVVTEVTRWPESSGPRRAGVSAYGYGGTIAHVILEQGDVLDRDVALLQDGDPAAGTGAAALYPLSAASRPALGRHAVALADRLAADPSVSTADVGYTLARRRAHQPYRAAVVAAGRDELIARLRAVATGEAATGRVLPSAGRGVVWVFSGHGSQWIGMGRQLIADEPAFASVIDTIEPIFAEELGVSARAALHDDRAQPVWIVQPMIFAVQVGIGAMLRSLGMRPAAVIGHSVGEIAAAVAAGVLTLDHAARLVCRRSVLLRAVTGQGAMAMVNLPATEVDRRLGDRGDVSVAIVAAPGSTVISGTPAAVAAVTARWRSDGTDVRAVDSDVAFHSAQMEPLLGPLIASAGGLTPGQPEIDLYTTALTDPRSAAPRDGDYWAANLRQPVRLAGAVTAAVDDGYRLFVEVSPHPVVVHSIDQTLEHLGVTDGFVTHTLRRYQAERETVLANAGALYCAGAPVDWAEPWPGGNLADLPTTAWQRRPHWIEEPTARSFLTEQHDPASHALLGGRINVYGTTPTRAWLTYLDRGSRPYPGGHPVGGVEIVPAAALLNTFLTTAESAAPPDLADVTLRVPVSLTRPRYVQIVAQDGAIRLSSRIADDEDEDELGWVTHTTADIRPRSDLGPPSAGVTLTGSFPTGDVIDRLAAAGVAAMGFHWTVERLARGDGAVQATVVTDPDSDPAPVTWAPLLDAALSIASTVFPGPPVLRMPAHIDRVTLAPHPPRRARVTVRIRDTDVADVELTDASGTDASSGEPAGTDASSVKPAGILAGRLTGLRFGVLDGGGETITAPRRLVHELAWRPMEPAPAHDLAAVALVGPDTPLLRQLARHLGDTGTPYRVALAPVELRPEDLAGERAVVVVPAAGTGGDVAPAAVAAAALLTSTAQRLVAAGSPRPARLWCLTRGVRECAGDPAVGIGAVWGTGRVIGGEYPHFWGGVIDVTADLTGVVDLIRGGGGEDVIAIRDGEASVPRLSPLLGSPVRPSMSCHPDGTYLITGGLGSLGLEVAHWLAERGARRIVLAGRRALPPRDRWDSVTAPDTRARIAAIRTLERLGVTVVPVPIDIADAPAAAALLSPAALGLPPIRGVVHAAGVLDNRMLRDVDARSLRTVLRPKVDGALVLHRLFPPGSLDFFVLFSSCGYLLGLPGQASYGAANAVLDALARHRRASGDRGTVSFGWTSWRGLGMSTSSAAIDMELAARGTADISATAAFRAWDLAYRHDLGYAAVLRTVHDGAARPAVLRDLPRDASPDDAATAASSPPDDAATAASSPPDDAATAASIPAGMDSAGLRAFLTERIRHEVATMTKLAVDEIDPRRPLVEMGVDSVMTVQIRRALERRLRLPIPATLLWDLPSIDAVTAFLAERIGDTP